jgi:replicative DNA helicase
LASRKGFPRPNNRNNLAIPNLGSSLIEEQWIFLSFPTSLFVHQRWRAADPEAEIVDFRDAYDAIIGEYASAYSGGSDYGFRFGWPTIDGMTGGLTKGDLASIVGRPSRGKTWQLLHAALNQWLEAGKAKLADPKADIPCEHSRLFVSMEMPVEQIRQRLAAMVAHVPAKSLKHAELSSSLLKKLKSGLLEIKGFGAPLWIVNGNLASTVEDIWIRARQLKPDAILIDGAYLLKHPTEKDRYRRVAENVELIKRELSPLAPTICSFQFAKSASAKKLKKTGGEATLDDVAGREAIGELVL